MNGEIAQLIALTCHGNAALRGMRAARFFPDNLTCRGSDYVRFREMTSGALLAATPDLWFDALRQGGADGLLLSQTMPEDAEPDDRMTAGFAGGGRVWTLTAVKLDRPSDIWLPDWETDNSDADDEILCGVNYYLVSDAAGARSGFRTLSAVKADFEATLHDVHAFSVKHFTQEGFSACFESALDTLMSAKCRPDHRQDLYPPGVLAVTAQRLLDAASAAWVFGGMGSWNDASFDEEQAEYERVSEALYSIINEAIAVAASSSWPGSGIND
jgi:hypothetical protein